jgi:hypothetical protein
LDYAPYWPFEMFRETIMQEFIPWLALGVGQTFFYLPMSGTWMTSPRRSCRCRRKTCHGPFGMCGPGVGLGRDACVGWITWPAPLKTRRQALIF